MIPQNELSNGQNIKLLTFFFGCGVTQKSGPNAAKYFSE